MATWAIAGRSASTLTRAVWRASNATNSATTRISLPASIPSWTRPNLTLRQSRLPPPSPKFLRRELSSLLPVHSVIASACLVSKLPSETSTSAEDFRQEVAKVIVDGKVKEIVYFLKPLDDNTWDRENFDFDRN